jgi:hypothetical protein
MGGIADLDLSIYTPGICSSLQLLTCISGMLPNLDSAERVPPARAAPTNYQQQMAKKLQVEPLRRGMGSA